MIMFTYSRCKPEATRTQETSSGGISVAITWMQGSLAVRKPLDTPAVGPLRSVSRVESAQNEAHLRTRRRPPRHRLLLLDKVGKGLHKQGRREHRRCSMARKARDREVGGLVDEVAPPVDQPPRNRRGELLLEVARLLEAVPE